MDLEKYRKAVYGKVCSHCIDLGESGKCTLEGDLKCGVELYLEKIIDVVKSVKSDKLDDYVKALREQVCSHCKDQSPDGTCQLREDVDCGLDRYFVLVVEAVEEVLNEKP
jgi:hypothetical protein